MIQPGDGMGKTRDTDGLSITENAKQAGADAFAQATGKGTYDALKDEGLSAEMLALWDCETVGALQERIGAGDPPAGFVLKAARAAYLAAALAALGVSQARKRGQGIGRS